MKYSLLLFTIALLNIVAQSQISSSYRWTWINGDNTANSYGIYGQKGVESATNKPGGRWSASNWTDAQGNLWLFGGYGYAASTFGYLNDLWKYNTSTDKWVWVAGDNVANAGEAHGALGEEGIGYTPAARDGAAQWVDATGTNLYLFSGNISDNFMVSDVWSFSTVSNKWRWVRSTMVDDNGACLGQAYGTAGEFTPGVWPVCRAGATAASSSGITYVFGGLSGPSFLNDLYRFSGTDIVPQNQWAYLDFSNDLNYPGKYTGTDAKPGGRNESMSFIAQDKYYVFGGRGYGYGTSGIQPGRFNDLWRYDGLDLFSQKPIWTWIKGDNTVNGSGNYGALGATSSTNNPPAKGIGSLTPAGNGQFILFGGYNSDGYYTNDVWSYDVNSNTWTWIGGNNFQNSFGNYGVKGVQKSTNVISARVGHASWITPNGDMYVFGGYFVGYNNDLWKFSTPLELITLDNISTNTICTGNHFSISYSVYPQASNPFDNSNFFRAELSDASGQFLNPVIIGTIQSKISGTITATIPANTPAGTHYRIRVVSSAPVFTSSDNDHDITINVGTTYYRDQDGDGFGDPSNTIECVSTQPAGYVTNNTDCDDNDPAIYPGAIEIIDGKDNNCNGQKDEIVQPATTLNFDGVNDYIAIPHNSLLKPSSQITIEAWVKPNNIHTNRYYEIYRKEDGVARHLLSFQEFGTILSFGLQVNGVYTELDVPINASDYEGQWVYVAATFDGQTKKIYRNGVLIGSENRSGSIGISGTAPVIIGSLDGTNEFFNGSIDEVRIWNKALSSTEISLNMTCELATPQSGLIAYYKFNQGISGGNNTGTTVLQDQSGNNLNGTLFNFALTGYQSNWIVGSPMQSLSTFYQDNDSDGFGDPNNSTSVCSTTTPPGYVINSGDCDDNNAAINPNIVWFLDADKDGYYTGTGITSCTSPGVGYKYTGLLGGNDCNDNNASIHPVATEICSNGIDDNCDGQIDEGCVIGLPSVSINDITVYESEGVAILTVSLSHLSTSNVTIGYATADGTATSSAPKGKKGALIIPDYVASKGNVIIPAGSLSATISIIINNDNVTEPDEAFTVNLSMNKPNSKIATINKGTATVTILDGSPITIARTTMTKEQELTNEFLSVKSSPNPSNSFFTISLSGNDQSNRILLRVIDIYGRVIESRNNLATGQTFKLGEKYRPGIYLVEVAQGNQRKTLKLIKQ